jgi:hypothetical protein
VVGPDCDDNNAFIFPAAAEHCNGLDDNCDDVVDNNAVDTKRFYADLDGDGYGYIGLPTDACALPDGLVDNSDDCDDDRDDVYPGAPEVCDLADNDCDGAVDPVTSVDVLTFYADTDGDGYGDAASPTAACAPPGGYVADATDCDDSTASRSPAAAEVCDVGDVDEDCDGLTDDGDSSATGQTSWYVDGDADGYGDEGASPVHACDQPVGYARNNDDCDDDNAARNPAGRHCPSTLDTTDATASFTGLKVSDFAGRALWAGDLTGDGVADYVLGAYYTGSGQGTVYVAFGPKTGAMSLSSADVTLADSTMSFLGYQVGSAGDADGDGDIDLGVLACKGGGYDVFPAPLTGKTTMASRNARLTAEVSTDYLTSALGAFDFDGDGHDDVAVGDTNYKSSTGAAYIQYGPLSGTSSLGSADIILHGAALSNNLGYSLAAADLDGDGADDLAIGANGESTEATDSGAVYVIMGGRASGTASIATADAVVYGASDYDEAGVAVAGGDVDGDGNGDVLLGAPRHGGTPSLAGKGAVYLMSGPLSATSTVADAAASMVGEAYGDNVGETLGEIRDLDGDGFGDLVVGAAADDTCGTTAGSVFVLYGPVSGKVKCGDSDVTITGPSPWAYFSMGLSSPGDLDGDGLGELFVGAYEAGKPAAGAAWVFDGADL